MTLNEIIEKLEEIRKEKGGDIEVFVDFLSIDSFKIIDYDTGAATREVVNIE